MATRAQAGGEIGKNGEYYKGGQFLPSTTLPKMVARAQVKATAKQEIAPYTWEVPTNENHRSIYNLVAGIFARWATWQKELEFAANDKTLAYYNTTREESELLISAWNNGARWFNKETGEII
jgi:hypothetical protein